MTEFHFGAATSRFLCIADKVATHLLVTARQALLFSIPYENT
jgi:hypothetical protein